MAKGSEPYYLISVFSGKALLSFADNACAFDFDYDEPASQEELTTLMSFSDMLKDIIDTVSDLSVSQKMALAFQLTDYIYELDDVGYMVFSEQANRILKGGALNTPDNFPVWIIRVLRKNNPHIIRKEINNNEAPIQTPEISG